MSITKIIIFGAKGTAVNIAEGIIDAKTNYNSPIDFLGFAFDDESIGTEVNGFPILCKTNEAWEKFKNENNVKFIFQMNHQNKMKERLDLINSYNIPQDRWFTFIHPLAYVARSAKIGVGTVIFAGCAIHSNVVIGSHCTFSALTTIGHDTTVGEHVFTATHVCIGSFVNLGDNLFFGQNSTVTSAISIEGGNLIGLGTLMLKNFTGTNKVIIGQPGKSIKNIL